MRCIAGFCYELGRVDCRHKSEKRNTNSDGVVLGDTHKKKGAEKRPLIQLPRNVITD